MTLTNLIKNALFSYLIISVDIFDGFETNFNVVNRRGVDFVGYILILLVTLGMDRYIEKNKEKSEPE